MATQSAGNAGSGSGRPSRSERAAGADAAALAADLLAYQCADPVLGGLMLALHTMVERTWDEFYYDDGPLPVYTLGFERSEGKGYFVSMSGALLPNYISLNPYVHSNGEEAIETLCHEVVHLWQHCAGLPVGHADHFRVRMAMMGIAANSKGIHVAFTDGRWQAWLVENEDLQLINYLLPGSAR